MMSKFQDGLPDFRPKQGMATWAYFWVDGEMSMHGIEIAPAIPLGTYHLAVLTNDYDIDVRDRDAVLNGTQVTWISREPVAADQLKNEVRKLAEERHPSPASFCWVLNYVPWDCGPTQENVRIDEVVS